MTTVFTNRIFADPSNLKKDVAKVPYITRKSYRRSHVSGKYAKGKGKQGSTSFDNNNDIREIIDSCARACETESFEEAGSSTDYVSPSSWYDRAQSKGKAAPSKGYTTKGAANSPRASNKVSSKGKGKGVAILRKNECCQGGASFLKIKITGIRGRRGSLALGIGSCSSSSPSKGGTNRNQNDERIQFIDCTDICIENMDETCETMHSNVNLVEDGQVVCFASWNPRTKDIDWKLKMPPQIFLHFDRESSDLSQEQDSLFAMIHTSCGDPVYAPYAIEMTTSCVRSTISLAETIGNTTNPVLHFQDGVASSFSIELSRARSAADVFDRKFATCGCFCQKSAGPTMVTSLIPSSSPAFSDNICNENCVQWTTSNCVIPGNELSAEQPCIADPKRSLNLVNQERHVDLLQRLLDSKLLE